jgi:hypothetical protein
MNLTTTVAPKSDQLNADDLIAGPITIRISGVTAGSAEQPVNISFDGDNKRPWKPSKGMRRVLIALYGADSSAYIGKRVTLFNDPTVTFGPDITGGIRISHASDIREAMTIALTVKKGKRKPYTVHPLAAEAPQTASNGPAMSPAELAELVDCAMQIGPEKAKEGMAALLTWGATLKAPVKLKLKDQIAAWKAEAEAVSK